MSELEADKHEKFVTNDKTLSQISPYTNSTSTNSTYQVLTRDEATVIEPLFGKSQLEHVVQIETPEHFVIHANKGNLIKVLHKN